MPQPPSPPRALRWIAVALPLLLLAGLLGWWLVQRNKPDVTASAEPVKSSASTHSAAPATLGAPQNTALAKPDDAPSNTKFHAWLVSRNTPAKTAADEADRVARGVALAQARGSRMARLIRENPEQAIAESVSFEQWSALPESVQVLVEKPFSVVAEYSFFPVCTPPGTTRPAGAPEYVAELHMKDGSKLEAFVYGQRRDLMSKRELPVQGIALGGAAAIRDGALQRVTTADLASKAGPFPLGQRDLGRSFVSGKPLAGPPVYAVAGGKAYVFADEAEMLNLSSKLNTLDAKPGLVAASSMLALPMGAAGAGGELNMGALEVFANEQASAWTETKKTLYLIRVNFTDNTAVPVSQAAAATEINGPSSDMIRAMSYGKSWFEGTVSANVYTMPQTASYYANGGSGLNAELLRDARNTFRNNKSGGDTAIDIGPVSATGNGDSGGLGNYDIVGVFFSSIGMISGGVSYAGLAGGGNLWVQNANYTSLYTHEWGHNYGLGHASFWQTSDGSAVGTGATVEYGDSYDVMGGGPAPEGHYHSQGKAKLNWLTTSEWVDATATGSGNYRIYREDDAATVGSPRGVRVTKNASVGNEEYYWLSFKPAFTNYEHLQHGAYLNWQRAGQTRCWLVDTTPATSGVKTDAPVDVGRTYADSSANVFITPLADGGTGAERYIDVRVNIGPFPGNAAPTASSITGPATVAARTAASFSVSASDSNGDALAYSWNMLDGKVNANASSISHLWDVGGSYNISVTVSDMKGGTLTLTKTITVTDPLDTWTASTVGTTDDLQNVVWGKGRFVAAEYWGGVFMSWDGSSWSNVGSPPSFDKQPVLAFGNDVFVIAGKIDNAAEAQICWSADGRLWAKATFPAGVPQVRGVTFGNGRFIAVGDGGTVLNSTDGKTWSLTTVGTAPNFRHITWDGASTWLAVAMNAAQSRPEVVWTSLDGVAWSQHSSLGVDVFKTFGAGGVMYAVGWYAGVMYSTDHGLTWQDALLPEGTRWTTYLMALAEDGTFFATAKAMEESGSPYALLVSVDGVHWTRSTANSGNTLVGNANGLAYGFGKFVTVEDGGIARSSNGLKTSNSAPVPSFTVNPSSVLARQNFQLAASATDSNGDALTYAWDFSSQFPIQDGASISARFLFGGSYTITLRVSDSRGGLATLTHNITVTDPVRTWTARTSGTTEHLYGVAASTSLVVAVGEGAVIRTSPDGVTWTSRSVTEYAGNMSFNSIVWDGAKFIIAGEDYNSTLPAGWCSLIYTSTDGITWTQRYRGNTPSTQLYAVATSGTNAVAVGNSGAVMTSANGTSWSVASIGGITSAETLRGVAWNGSVFALVGHSGTNGAAKVFTSTNGSSWIDRSAGAGVANWQDLRKIAWLKDRFVSSGWYSSVRVSTDNAQTFTTTRSHREENPAMAYGDGIYYTAGVDRDAADVDVDVLSLDGVTWYSYAAPTTNDRNAAVFYQHHFISVGDSGSIWQSGDTTPAASFAIWQTTHFPGGGVAALATSDPDKDGVLNLEEYSLSLDPNSAAAGNGISSSVSALLQSGRARLHINMPQPALPDITYTVQGNSSLTGTWVTLAQKVGSGAWLWLGGGTSQVTLGTISSGRVPVEVGVPDSAVGQSRYFLRLQMSND